MGNSLLKAAITPITKRNLPDDLADAVRKFIVAQHNEPGNRLPTISDLARQFGVGQPTLREALKKLETIGVITIKHGSGIYVGDHIDSLFLPNPIAFDRWPSRKIMLDLIQARIPIELKTVALAAEYMTDEHTETMGQLLAAAEENLENDAALSQLNLSFHRSIAQASRNTVLHQILSVITTLFDREQQMIMYIFHSKVKDYQQHLEIYQALKQRDAPLAVKTMEAHLESVHDAILRWDPDIAGSQLAENE